jgi:hypothetical protein
VVDGPVGEIPGHFDHYPFSKGMSHWLARHNGYSSMEAAQIVADRSAGKQVSLRLALVAKDRNTRRQHQKSLFYRMPCRPLVKFLMLYGLKRGFLDGRAGLTYAMLQSVYEYMIVLKTRELEEAARDSGRREAEEIARSAPPRLVAPTTGVGDGRQDRWST